MLMAELGSRAVLAASMLLVGVSGPIDTMFATYVWIPQVLWRLMRPRLIHLGMIAMQKTSATC